MESLILKVQQFMQKFKYNTSKNTILALISMVLAYDFLKLGKAGYINYIVDVIKSIGSVFIKKGGTDITVILVLIFLYIIFKK